MTAFWNEEDERWCEECDDYLQQYIGLALLKEYQQVVDETGKIFMKQQLILAEKPSVAKDLSKVLGCEQKHKVLRRTQGDCYLGPWSFMGLKMPEDLNKDWASWQMETLPMIPKSIGIKPLPKPVIN